MYVSVLDDNKLLTLPNGERLNLPPNVRIMFEVDGVAEDIAREALRLGAAKLPVRTRVIQRIAD